MTQESYLLKTDANKFVGNKAKGRISKRSLEENKARQIFQKNEHFLPRVRIRG